MAFGIKKEELKEWKRKINRGDIAFLTHYWLDDRFPDCTTVTKVGCNDLDKLAEWGKKYGLRAQWIHQRKDGYSHYDLLGEKQAEILEKEGLLEQIRKLKVR
ncbi:hypothetical protein RRV45_10480 [Bacillus sp. DTU_2020_1000418_1_SI_GHA_SEK_038]|uniref:hypothetical protein n=1 Tax=Bacillus sp. DTU_2020_1000418_1_SI_GHA_SEK_038 TaxID=3077585 RepID=UPI0028EC1AC6|nr:hypothetical protein [Bacillus sp. DTU_2020_1000418_1_SI_GHA_SEK_038]WNS77381.1 hypothetical protein RRV45_10480 [Bacillus sp. DTU_2020_1000418_1_SI_GHA_SEK_038]